MCLIKLETEIVYLAQIQYACFIMINTNQVPGLEFKIHSHCTVPAFYAPSLAWKCQEQSLIHSFGYVWVTVGAHNCWGIDLVQIKYLLSHLFTFCLLFAWFDVTFSVSSWFVIRSGYGFGDLWFVLTRKNWFWYTCNFLYVTQFSTFCATYY
jgi:hypothetical protein